MLDILKDYASLIMALVSVINLIIAGMAWSSTKRSAQEAARTADATWESVKISETQIYESIEARNQNTNINLFDHRAAVYNQLKEWIDYARVMCNTNIGFEYATVRFISMVNKKTHYVPLDSPIIIREEIIYTLVRLESEKNIILMFDILFEELSAEDCAVIRYFVNAFIDMVFHIEEEMGKPKSIFHYSKELRKATLKITTCENNIGEDILSKMKKEMKPISKDVDLHL